MRRQNGGSSLKQLSHLFFLKFNRESFYFPVFGLFSDILVRRSFYLQKTGPSTISSHSMHPVRSVNCFLLPVFGHSNYERPAGGRRPWCPPTQLADSRPQLDQPLRVTIPVNAPMRAIRASQDEYIQKNAFSPMALSATKSALPELLGVGKGNSEESKGGSAKGGDNGSAAVAGTQTAIADFSTLAFSSKRSGKKDKEAIAYVSLGVIYDNQGNQQKAIENYQLYADLSD